MNIIRLNEPNAKQQLVTPINNRRVVFEGWGGRVGQQILLGEDAAVPKLFHYFNVQDNQSTKLKLTTKNDCDISEAKK